jgi:hypothetical protein
MFTLPPGPTSDSPPAVQSLRLSRSNVDALDLVLVRFALTCGARERFPSPDNLHINEAGCPDGRDVLSFQESAADSGGPDRDVIAASLRDVLVHDDVRKLQPPA